MKRLEDQRKAESERMNKCHDHGIRVGLILVPTSPRRYQVIELDHNAGCTRRYVKGDYDVKTCFTIPTGHVVYTGTYQNCVQYIEDNGEALPEDLWPKGA